MSKVTQPGSSLVVQWLRICPPVQGTQIRFLVGKPRPHMPWGDYAHTTTEPVRLSKDPAQLKTKQNPKRTVTQPEAVEWTFPFCLTMAGKRKLRAGMRSTLCTHLWWGASWGPCRWESGVTVPFTAPWYPGLPGSSQVSPSGSAVSPRAGVALPPRPSLPAQLSSALGFWGPASLHGYLIFFHLIFCTCIS